MEIFYSTRAKEDFIYWKKNNSKLIERINKLLNDIKLHPFKGLGKPEPLKFVKIGYWSRRIDQEHRLVYKISNDIIYIVQCRYHY
jgi:toxin YoeB